MEGSYVHCKLRQSTQTTLLVYSTNIYIFIFKFLYGIFYNGNHPVGFLKGKEFLDQWSSHKHVRTKGSVWRLLFSHVLNLLILTTQTNSCYQFYTVQNAYNRCVLFQVMREHNLDVCGCVTELHGLCGRWNLFLQCSMWCCGIHVSKQHNLTLC